MPMDFESQTSLASNGIPTIKSYVEETMDFNVAEGIDMLKNTNVSDIFDEGYPMETDENDSKPVEEFEHKKGVKDVEVKEISREEENKKSDSLNMLDDGRTFEDTANGGTTDIYLKNAVKEISREKEDEKLDSLTMLDDRTTDIYPVNALKEISRKEEDEKPDSLNVLEDGRDSEDIPNGGTVDIYFENALKEISREKEDQNSDSLNVLDDGRTFEDSPNGGTTGISFENALKETSREEEDEKSDSLNVLDDGRTFEDNCNSRTTDIYPVNSLKEISREEEDEKPDSLNVLEDERTFEDIPNGGTVDIYLENVLKEISREKEDENSVSLNVLDDGRTFEDIPDGGTTDISFGNASKEIFREKEDENSDSLNVLDDGRTFEDIPDGGTIDISFENASKEISREEDDGKSDSLNVPEDRRTFEDSHNSGTTDKYFENALKEISREEEDEKSDSLNVLDDARNFEDIPNSGTTDIYFENALKEIPREEEYETSHCLSVLDDARAFVDIPNIETTDIHFENVEDSEQFGQKREENEQEDSPYNEGDAKMSQIENRNDPHDSDSTAMLDLVRENSRREFINEDCFEDNHLHQSAKIEGRGQIGDVQAIEDTEWKGAGQVEDKEMGVPVQHYAPEPPAVVKHLEPEEAVHQNSMENTASETQNAIEENVFHSEPETKILPMQTDAPSLETKWNEWESTASETQNAIEEDVFHSEPETKILPMQTDAPSLETKWNEFEAEKIHLDTDSSLEFSSMPESESSFSLRRVEDSIQGPMGRRDPKQFCEDCDIGLEYFSSALANSLSGSTYSDDFNAESAENESYIMPKSDDIFSLLRNGNNVSTESTDDANFASRNEEFIDFVITAGGEAPIIDQALEMDIAEAMSEKDSEPDTANQDVHTAEEHGVDTMEAGDIDSNANTQPEECREQPLSLQENSDVTSAIGVDKGHETPNPEEENSPDCQAFTISAMEHDDQQSNAAEEEQMLVVLGRNGAQFPSESGAADDHANNGQELSPGENLICEQSLLELQQPNLPLRSLGEKDSWAESNKDEQQQQMESVELSFAIDESELSAPREGVETVELPFATDELSCKEDCDQVAESSFIEKTEDTSREATDMDAGNHMRQYIETVGSACIVDETEGMCKKGIETVESTSPVDEAESTPNECFKTAELSCAIDETEVGIGVEALSNEQQFDDMIAEVLVTENLPEAVREDQIQTRMGLQKGSEEMLKSTSLDKNNVDDHPTANLHRDSSPTVQAWTPIKGDSTKAMLSCAIDETEVDIGVEALSDEQQFDDMIAEVLVTENLPEAVREDQIQTRMGLQKGSEEMLKCTSLDKINVDDDPTANLHRDSSPTVQVLTPINGDSTKATLSSAIDETDIDIGVEALSDEQQFNGMIAEVSVTENLPEAVREDQIQTKVGLQKGVQEMLKCTSLDKNNVDDDPTANLHRDSSPAVQVWAQINGDSAKDAEPDTVDMTAEYPSDDDKCTVTKNEAPGIEVSQTPVQVSESLRMDNGLMENRLVSEQQGEVKLQIHANEVMAKTTSQIPPRSSFSEPVQVIPQEQLTIPTTEVHNISSLTSNSETSLKHRGQTCQDLQINEQNDRTLTVPREK
ncbi:hypothetical protein KI387_022813, partial [Taxus chinensis]